MAMEVLVEVENRVAVITLNRPSQRNALNSAVRKQLPAAIRALDADDSVDVMILTGADPAFSAGVDLKEFGSAAPGAVFGDSADPGVRRDDGRLPYRGPIPPREKLLIGAVNGVAVTGGFEVALNCDFLIASDRARFADTHARVGVMPGWGLTVLLAARIGVTRARQMSVTGNYIDAQLALQWGLVNEVVAHDELLDRCKAIANDCISIDQRAVRRMLKTYAEVSDTTVGEGWAFEDAASRAWQGSGYDPAEIEAKRQGILDRGRNQVA